MITVRIGTRSRAPKLCVLCAFAVPLFSCGKKENAPDRTDAAPSAVRPECAQSIVITTRFQGSFIGGGLDGAVDGVVIGVAAQPGAFVARLYAAPPFYAAETSLEETCADEAPSNGPVNAIAVRCIGPGGRIRRVVVRTEGKELAVEQDGVPAHKWDLPGGAPGPGRCFELHGLGKTRDLEPLRAAWGNDAKKCVSTRGAHATPTQVPVVIEFPKLEGEDQPHCAESGTLATSSSRVVVSIPALDIKRDLGRLDNQCGMVTVSRFDDANAISIETSDMDESRRVFYQLGAMLYVTGADGRLSAIPLPCGARAVFDMRYPFAAAKRTEKMRSE
jgi:hypothetical protein